MNGRLSVAVRFLAPWAAGFVLFMLAPMSASLVLSMTRNENVLALQKPVWVGAENFRHALGVEPDNNASTSSKWHRRLLGGRPTDPLCYRSLYNSFVYTFLAVPPSIIAALLIALLLNQPLRGMGAFRAVIYLPHVLGGVATLMIWSWLLNPQFGWFNQLLRYSYEVLDTPIRFLTGYGTSDWPLPNWLYSHRWCKPAVAMMHVWTMGGAMLVFLAGLRRIPRQLRDAAELDGAGVWQRFVHVTWPQLTPMVLFNVVVGILFCMQAFSEAYVLQNRRQEDGLLFYTLYVFRSAFEPPYRLGYACALAWILFAVLALLIAPLWVSARWWVHYDLSRRNA